MKSRVILPPDMIYEIGFQLKSWKIRFGSKLRYSMSKKRAQNLSKEVIEFLKKYSRPPLDEFIRSKKYRLNDYVSFIIPFKELVKAGVLWKVRRGEHVYWVLQDRILSPREYLKLYLLSRDTTRTLMYEIGFLEVYDKYKDRFKVIEDPRTQFFATFLLDGVVVAVSERMLRASRYVRIPVRYGPGDNDVFNFFGEIIYILNKASVSDIEKMMENIRTAKFLIEEILWNIVSYAKRELGDDIVIRGNGGRSISVEIIDHKIVAMDVCVDMGSRRDDSRLINVWFKFDKRGLKEKGKWIYPPQDLVVRVSVSRTVDFKSLRYLREEFDYSPIGEKTSYVDTSPLCGVKCFFDTRSITLSYNESFKETTVAPGIRKIYYMLGSLSGQKFVEFVKDKIWGDLREKSDKILFKNRDRESVTVGDFLKFLRWSDDQDLDEILFKLSVISLEARINPFFDGRRYAIVSKLIALALLNGHDERKVLQAVNRPLETLLELARNGKLYITLGKNSYKVKLKGKILEEIFSLHHYRPTENLEELLQSLVSIVIPREKLEKLLQHQRHKITRKDTVITT